MFGADRPLPASQRAVHEFFHVQPFAGAVLAKPEIRTKLAEMGTDPVGLAGDAFGARIKTELERNDALVREFGIKVN